jgi:hypothetical protein
MLATTAYTHALEVQQNQETFTDRISECQNAIWKIDRILQASPKLFIDEQGEQPCTTFPLRT